MKKYEIMYIIRPNIEDEAKKALIERFDGVLTSNGAEIIESKDWGKRRLAYEIEDFREGLYHLIHANATLLKRFRNSTVLRKSTVISFAILLLKTKNNNVSRETF